MDVVGKVNDAVLHDSLQLLLIDSERGLHLIKRVQEVLSPDLNLINVVRDAGEGAHLTRPVASVSPPVGGKAQTQTHLDVSIERETRRTLDQTPEFGTTKVLGQRGQLDQIDIMSHDAIGAHLARLNVENLHATRFVRQ